MNRYQNRHLTFRTLVFASIALAPAGCLLEEDRGDYGPLASESSQALTGDICLGPESLERENYDFLAPTNIKRNPGQPGVAPVVFPVRSLGPDPVYGQFDADDLMSVFALREKVTSGTPVPDFHRGLDFTYYDPNGTDAVLWDGPSETGPFPTEPIPALGNISRDDMVNGRWLLRIENVGGGGLGNLHGWTLWLSSNFD